MDWADQTVWQIFRLADGYVACLHTPFGSLYPHLKLQMGLAVLLPLVNQAQVFYDARGCTGVRMTLRVG